MESTLVLSQTPGTETF